LLTVVLNKGQMTLISISRIPTKIPSFLDIANAENQMQCCAAHRHCVLDSGSAKSVAKQ